MTITPSLLAELHGAVLVGVPILVLFAACEILHRRFGVSGEHTRKVSHLGAGVVVFAMPWLVHSHWTVLAMAGGFAIILGGSKVLGLLPSVHAVSRRTSGAWYYPIAIYGTWLLADGDALLFQVPVLVMALSDTGAAVVGRRYGVVRYRVIEDYRSLGGSVTFFGLTFAVVLVALGTAGAADLPAVLVVTLLTAIVVTAVEGVSVHGADNLFVPYATFMMLRTTLAMDRDGLGTFVLGAALVLGILFASFRQARLNTTGFMATFLGGTVAFGLGGPVWLATLLVPYLGFAAFRPLTGDQREADLEVIVPAFAVSLMLVLVAAHTGNALLFAPFLASVASVTAMATAGAARHRGLGPGTQAALALVGAALTLLPAAAMTTPLPITPGVTAAVLFGALLGPAYVHRSRGRGLSGPAIRMGGVVSGTTTALVWAAGQVLL